MYAACGGPGHQWARLACVFLAMGTGHRRLRPEAAVPETTWSHGYILGLGSLQSKKKKVPLAVSQIDPSGPQLPATTLKLNVPLNSDNLLSNVSWFGVRCSTSASDPPTLVARARFRQNPRPGLQLLKFPILAVTTEQPPGTTMLANQPASVDSTKAAKVSSPFLCAGSTDPCTKGVQHPHLHHRLFTNNTLEKLATV